MPRESLAIIGSRRPSHLLRVLHSMFLGWGTVALVYFATGWLSTEAVTIPQVWLDHRLGFTVNAVWWYLSFFLLIPYTYFTACSVQLLTLRYAMQISAVVSGLFFIWLPTSLVYPEITQTGVSADLLQLLISVDSPHNCFPSLHASLTTICVASGLQVKRFLRSTVMFCVGLAILTSIIMLRRHLTIDVGGGVAVGVLSYIVAGYLTGGKSSGQSNGFPA